MNRPTNRPLYSDELEEYVDELEKYCDELEQSNKSLSNAYDDCLVTLHFWEEEYHKYRKALDRACETLVTYDTKGNYAKLKWNKDKWKEWCLKDD